VARLHAELEKEVEGLNVSLDSERRRQQEALKQKLKVSTLVQLMDRCMAV
jgi:hypothetical protein